MLNIILYFFSNMIEICALGIYCELLFSPRYSKRTRFILLPVFCIVLFIVSLFRNPLLNISLFAFIFSFYIFTQFKIRWYICLFHTLILTALDSITEMVVFGVLNYYFPNTIPSLTNASAHFLLVLFSKPLYLFIVQIIGQLLHNKNQSNQCSRSKFLTNFLKTFDKDFREIFPGFTDTKRRAEPSAFLTIILQITPTLQQRLHPHLRTLQVPLPKLQSHHG